MASSLAGQRQHRRADPNVPADRVKDDIAGFEHRAERLPGSSQQRLGSRDQLDHGEGFDKIVVRPCVQAGHTRLDRITGRQHQNGHKASGSSQLRQKIQPVAIRQPKIENDGIVRRERKRRASVSYRGNRVHREAGPA